MTLLPQQRREGALQGAQLVSRARTALQLLLPAIRVGTTHHPEVLFRRHVYVLTLSSLSRLIFFFLFFSFYIVQHQLKLYDYVLR